MADAKRNTNVTPPEGAREAARAAIGGRAPSSRKAPIKGSANRRAASGSSDKPLTGAARKAAMANTGKAATGAGARRGKTSPRGGAASRKAAAGKTDVAGPTGGTSTPRGDAAGRRASASGPKGRASSEARATKLERRASVAGRRLAVGGGGEISTNKLGGARRRRPPTAPPIPESHTAAALDALASAGRLILDEGLSPEAQLSYHLAAAQVHATLQLAVSLDDPATGAGSAPTPAQPLELSPMRKRVPKKGRVRMSFEERKQASVAGLGNAPKATLRFAEEANDRANGHAWDVDAPSTSLLVAFGGLGGHMGLPPFEFFRITQDLSVKKGYIRDIAGAWYHHGVDGLGDTIDAVAAHLRVLIDESGARHVVFAGNSAGGYAALLFGALVGVNQVMSFAPQTTIRSDQLAEGNDDRWTARLMRASKFEPLEERYLDLREMLLRNPPPGDSDFAVHYPRDFELDAFHARRLSGVPGIELIEHDNGDHGLIRRLRDSGRLSQMLQAAVVDRPDPSAATTGIDAGRGN